MAPSLARTLTSPAAPSEAARTALPLARRFGRYQLLAQLGRGGVADVFLAEAVDLEGVVRQRVIKVLRPVAAASWRRRASLAVEAALAAQLRHPAIVRIEALGRQRGRDYLVMEYVDGLDLAAALERSARLGLPFAPAYRMTILCSMLEALDFAHRARDERGRPLGIVHRDVSPSNVLISRAGEVKLCDFGTALWAQRGDDARRRIEGKAGYMSPEHARGEAVDQRSDIFAAGVLLWELLQGRRRIRAADAATKLALAAQGRVPAMAVRGWPGEMQLHAVARRALAAVPADRYPTVAEMHRDLRRVCRAHGLLVGQGALATWLARLADHPDGAGKGGHRHGWPAEPAAGRGCARPALAHAPEQESSEEVDAGSRPSESGPRLAVRVRAVRNEAREPAGARGPVEEPLPPSPAPLRLLALGRSVPGWRLSEIKPLLALGGAATALGLAVLHALALLGAL